ncbi:heptosyltransferase II [Candidatus Magnetomoraceae bacterium gMMP-13]
MNILIVKTSAIGDVTHTLPALNAIRAHYPDAHITWLVEEAAADIITGHKALNRVLVSKRKSWIKQFKDGLFFKTLKEIYNFIKKLRDTEYDLLIDFQSLLKSGIFIGLSRAKRKTGYGRGMEHAEHSYIFLNERIPPVNMNNHAVLRELMLLKEIGIKCRKIIFDFPINNFHRNEVNDLLRSHNINENFPLISINPMTKWKTKLWENEKFANVADNLIERGCAVVFTGSKEDRLVIKKISYYMKNKTVNLAGETTLKILAALYERSEFLISTDTGPMHIAAAVGTPVIALFGPTAPWRTGPFGNNHKIVRLDLKCSPCLKRNCETIECMKNISVEQVLNSQTWG